MDESSSSQSIKLKLILPATILFASILISASLFITRGGGPATIKEGSSLNKSEREELEITTENNYFLGSLQAPVEIVEFSDYQCSFCRVFWREALVQIKKEYVETGKARFIYKDFPLDSHPIAGPAAEAARCAGDQERFWEMHDKIFEEQDKISSGTVQFNMADIKKWSVGIGLNTNEFNNCLDSGKHRELVKKDYEEGIKLGVSGTPTIFINGRKVVGAQAFGVFKSIIEEELAK